MYDPTAGARGANAAGWSAEYVTPDWSEFVGVFWSSTGCLAIVDEAADVFEEDRNRARMMLRRGRHVDPATGGGGHVVLLISQRYVGFDKTAREQCSRLYAFNQSPSDAKLLAEDYNCPALLDVPKLAKFHYITIDRLGEPKRGHVTP